MDDRLMRSCSFMWLPVFLLMTAAVHAGEYNEVLSVGDSAPAWKNLPGTDGKQHSLADFNEKPVVVVVFTCASCPTATDYESRINALCEKYSGEAGKVAVIAICVNQVEQDKPDALKQRVDSEKLRFHYLYDETQKIAKQYGAVFTPEFYVLDANRKIIYMGAMDDETDAAKVTQRYVEDAVNAALTGKEVAVKEVIARGCRVRYARERRK